MKSVLFLPNSYISVFICWNSIFFYFLMVFSVVFPHELQTLQTFPIVMLWEFAKQQIIFHSDMLELGVGWGGWYLVPRISDTLGTFSQNKSPFFSPKMSQHPTFLPLVRSSPSDQSCNYQPANVPNCWIIKQNEYSLTFFDTVIF